MFIVSDLDESFTAEFHSNKDGLYAAKPGPKYLKFIEMKNKQKLREYETNFVQTLNGQLKNFAAGEIERGRKARILYHMISAPDLTVMKKHYNQLCDIDIPWEDVLVRHPARRACHDINIFPNKKGISETFSPYTIMGRRNFSVKTECQHELENLLLVFKISKRKGLRQCQEKWNVFT